MKVSLPLLLLPLALVAEVPPSAPAPGSLKAAAVRMYTRDEARVTIERDWLDQVGGKPDVWQEIARTRTVASRLGVQAYELDSLAVEASNDSLSADNKTALYLSVRRIRRGLMLGNPVVNFVQLLMVDMSCPEGAERTYATGPPPDRYSAAPDGHLIVVDGLSLDGKARSLMPQTPLYGSFRRPDLSFDGRRVLFSFKPHSEESFHIYEINLDGTGLRQITSGICDDFDPVYLPDGKGFIFSTTRRNPRAHGNPPADACMLARCGLDGGVPRLLSANNGYACLPAVMNDGRILYNRSVNLTEEPLRRTQELWTMNPDGTQPAVFGSTRSACPDFMNDARPIPGSRRVMFTGCARTNGFAGSIGIFDPDKGANIPNGLTRVTAEIGWPESGNGPAAPIESPDYQAYGNPDSYQTPYPLGEKDFLVSARRGGKFVLYLMDTDGNRELVYEGANHVFHAQPVRSRPVPPVLH